MAARPYRKRKELVVPPDRGTTVITEKAKVKPTRVRGKVKEASKLKADKALAKVQEALRAAQAKVKQERRARAKAEKALAEAQEVLAASRLKAEHQLPIRRVSFVVRLTIYESSQIGRTEIEHVESSRKHNFLGLDGEQIASFMKECISPATISEPADPPASSAEKILPLMQRSLRPQLNLNISEILLFRLGEPDLMTLILARDEPFGLRVCFQLQGPDAQVFNVQELSFAIKIYVNEIASGRSRLHTICDRNIVGNVLKYIASVEVPGLSFGLYRLFTVITLHTPLKLTGFYGKTIVHVI